MGSEPVGGRNGPLVSIEMAYADLRAALAGLDEAPATGGQWTVTQVIAHVANDETWLAAQLEALVRGELPTRSRVTGRTTRHRGPKTSRPPTSGTPGTWHASPG